MGESNMKTLWKPAGTILYGRAMLAQFSYEMMLLKVQHPEVITIQENMKSALRSTRKMAPNYLDSIQVTVGDPSPDTDFLILAGGKDLTDRYAYDIRPKALIPLTIEDLASINEPVSDYLVIDSSLIKDKECIESFFHRYASAISEGLIQFPNSLQIPSAFIYSCRTAILSGEASLDELPRILKDKHVQHPLIVTDKGVVGAGLLETLLKTVEGFDVEIFDSTPQDSSFQVVNELSRIYNKKNRDGLIAFGGGSVLDTGKGVYLNVSLDNDKLYEWEGSNRIPKLNTPFIAIPTTSGTGSEVTKASVITNEQQGKKVLFISTHLQPDIAILDSRLTVTLPAQLTSTTAMDALSHAVEAFTCLGKNPLSDQMAWTAIELIRENLIPAVEAPTNLEYRQNLAYASNLAGQAFSNSMVGMVHTVGHSVGAVCHIPHGSCMAILLPHVLEYNFNKIKQLLAELLPALTGSEADTQTPINDRARLSIETIRKFNRTLKEITGGRHPERFREILSRKGDSVVNKSDFIKIAETAMGDASIAYNPEELHIEDVLEILEKSF
jgi:alcohol dehydrogenase